MLFQGFLPTILPDKGKILIEIIVFHILHHTKPLAYVNKFAMMDASPSYHLPSSERNQVSFTLEEAKALIGSTLQVKMQEPFEIHDDIVLHPDQEGTIIGVSGEYTEEGIPELSIAIQFWPTDEESVPVITLVEQSAFTTHFSLTGKQP